MSWLPGFSALWGAWLFLLLIPLVIFYFLKLKRPRLEIASLALWRQVISDQRVNAPFQKFKRNLLLLLQVLALCLLALAAMQPFLPGNTSRSEYLPILVDSSASMGAVDERGVSRLDLAKEEIRDIIAGLLPGQQLQLIAVDSTSRTLTEFTDNKQLLRATLDQIAVSDVPSHLEDGLQVAQASTLRHTVETVRLYSDGNLPTRPNPAGQPIAAVEFDLSYKLQFHQIDAAGRNMGITALNARRASVEQWDVFVRVEGGKAASSAGEVQLFNGGAPLTDAHPVALDAGQSQRLVFRVSAGEPVFLEARLSPDGHDSLAADNKAYLELPAGRELIVYCAPPLVTYRHALSKLGGILLDPNADGKMNFTSYDLVISDTREDLARDSTTHLMVGVIPDDLAGLMTVETGLAEVVDWKRDAPLLQHVQLKDVQISDLTKRAEGVVDGNFEELGYELLAFGSEGPLIVQKRDRQKLRFFLLFHTDRSTLPYRVGFPILVQNAVNLALQQASLSELRGLTTGVLPPLELTANERYRIAGPDGASVDLTANENGLLDGVPAPRVGEYDVRRGGELVQRFGVGLLDATETSLAAVDEIHFREVSVGAEDERQKTDKPLWSMLAAAAFALLLLEWWFFQKKPAGMPA